jgi:putative nucleotidyltransferase with HDIG domain
MSSTSGFRAIEFDFPPGTNPLSSEPVQLALAFAEKHGVTVYLVGGYLRDALLKAKGSTRPFPPIDYDFAVLGTSAFDYANEFAASLSGHYVPLDEKTDTARVVLDSGISFDFAGCVGGDIAKDVFRRDFTINGLYWDPKHPDKMIDLVGGLADLENRSIRAISEHAFVDDPLRMLRAFRFAAKLNYKLDRQTLAWIQKHRQAIVSAAPERINLELFATFAVRDSKDTLKDLAASGLLEEIFPELAGTRVVTKNAYHHLDLFEHSFETVIKAEEELSLKPDWISTDVEEELSHGITRLAATKLACLLHDIGKPATWVITPEGKHTFIAHDRLGADMVAKIGDRLRWSKPVDKFITKLVEWHLRPGQLFHGSEGLPTDKAIHRFYRKAGRDVPELILLSLGDLGATQGPSMVGDKANDLRENLIELLSKYAVFIKESKETPKLMDGKDVMNLLGIGAGPQVGEILSALEEAQGFKEVTNRTQAEAFVRDLYRSSLTK